MKYAYPAVFREESDGLYSVEFPDLEGCFTSGETLPDAIEMAEDALCLMLYDMEEDGETIPAPSNPKDIVVSETSYTPDQIRIMEAGATAQTGNPQEAEVPTAAAEETQAEDAK